MSRRRLGRELGAGLNDDFEFALGGAPRSRFLLRTRPLFLLLVCIKLSREFSFKINFTTAGASANAARLDEPPGKSRERNKLSGFSRALGPRLPLHLPLSRQRGM